MKKLLDILTNPRSSVSMDLLIKCEAALKKMERVRNSEQFNFYTKLIY